MDLLRLFQTRTQTSVPDSAASWFNAAIVFAFNFMQVGVSHFMGSLFVTVMDGFDLSREEAAMTINFYSISYSMSGIFVGYTTHKLGPKAVLCLSNTVAIIGLFSAAMVPVSKAYLNYFRVSMVIYGAAMTYPTVVVMEIIAGHFVTHRGKALTLGYVAVAISLTVHPGMYPSIINAYGFRGSWLIYACFLTQGLLPLYILQVQNWPQKAHIPVIVIEDETCLDSSGLLTAPATPEDFENNNKIDEVSKAREEELNLIRSDYQLRMAETDPNEIKRIHRQVNPHRNNTTRTLHLVNFKLNKFRNRQLDPIEENGEGDYTEYAEFDQASTGSQEMRITSRPSTYEPPSPMDPLETYSLNTRGIKRKPLVIEPRANSYYENLRGIFSNYRVYVQFLCQVVGGVSHLIVCNTIVDFGMDTGLSFLTASNFYTIMCVGGFFGLFLAGWYMDWTGMSDDLKMSLSMLFPVVSYLWMSIARGWPLFVGVFLCGFAYALSSSMRNQITTSFGLDTTSTILGVGFFLSGCLQFSVPYLIGLCRDVYGSYVYLYLILTVGCLFASLLYLAVFFYRRSTTPTQAVTKKSTRV